MMFWFFVLVLAAAIGYNLWTGRGLFDDDDTQYPL
jgi:hypothetical protein